MDHEARDVSDRRRPDLQAVLAGRHRAIFARFLLWLAFGPAVEATMRSLAETTTMSVKIQWPTPAHWEDFDSMCYRLAQAERTLVSGRKYGRHGQEQHGVDIV